ncbi:MAG: hypothetical protein GY796_28850 [Chloroflexi bacterium]|nr:hypothetical protein [Chloroflexota bacterium]
MYYARAIRAQLTVAPPLALTQPEQTILRLAAEGLSNRGIGQRIGLSIFSKAAQAVVVAGAGGTVVSIQYLGQARGQVKGVSSGQTWPTAYSLL